MVWLLKSIFLFIKLTYGDWLLTRECNNKYFFFFIIIIFSLLLLFINNKFSNLKLYKNFKFLLMRVLFRKSFAIRGMHGLFSSIGQNRKNTKCCMQEGSDRLCSYQTNTQIHMNGVFYIPWSSCSHLQNFILLPLNFIDVWSRSSAP